MIFTNDITQSNDSKKKYIIINGFLICLNNLSIGINTINDIIINLQTIVKKQNLYKYYKTNGQENIDITTPTIIITNSPITTFTNINFKHNNYFILHNSKLYNKYTKINTLLEIHKNIMVFNVNERQIGGTDFFGMLEGIIKIGKFFLMIGKVFEWLGKLIYWIIMFIVWLFYDLLNPATFFNSFLDGLMSILIAICRVPFDLFMTLFAFSTNMVGGWMQGLWGWDQSGLTKVDRDSNYFKNINRNQGKKCYLTQSNTVPFSIIIGTILCPPIGVFMTLGLTGWLNIIVCCLLTLCFYLPGLTYALLIIFS